MHMTWTLDRPKLPKFDEVDVATAGLVLAVVIFVLLALGSDVTMWGIR